MNDTQTEASAVESEDYGWEWAIVEIFGHRQHVGRTREEERFGVKMLRIDVPLKGDPAVHGWQTHYYGGSSIFSFSFTDKVSALLANRLHDSPYRLSYADGVAKEFDDHEDVGNEE